MEPRRLAAKIWETVNVLPMSFADKFSPERHDPGMSNRMPFRLDNFPRSTWMSTAVSPSVAAEPLCVAAARIAEEISRYRRRQRHPRAFKLTAQASPSSSHVFLLERDLDEALELPQDRVAMR